MASIDKVAKGYRARWRTPDGSSRSRTFGRKVDAERWLTSVEHSKLSGAYVDPSAGRTTVEAYAQQWTQRRTWRPATVDRVEREFRLYIIPAFGRTELRAVRRPEIERWAATLPLAPSSVRRIVETFGTMMASAAADEVIPRNPVTGARLPSAERAPLVPLSVDEVWRMADAVPSHMRAAVVLSAGTGLRQGEAMAVTIDRVDFLRRSVRVDRQLWTPKAGQPVFAPPKTRRGYRTVALSSVVLDVLSAHIAEHDTGDDGLLFHFEGRAISRAMVAKHMRAASARAGVKATWHDLRHHHASTLLSAGVSPALVAERLGHDIGTLLATYAHVIRSDEDRVRAIVEDTLGARVSDLCHDAQ
jgi:integrase